MKRMLLAAGLALTLGVAPVAGQTRVSVAVAFGVPRPYVTGVVIVGTPHVYYPPRRAFYYRYRPSPFVARRIYLARHRRHHHRYYYDDDCDND